METPQPRPKYRSLRTKILVLAALPVTIILTCIIGLLIRDFYRDLFINSARKIDLELAAAAQQIDRKNLEAVTVPKIMALAQENGLFGKRAESIEYARRVLEQYPQFTGSYFGYETNADNQDADFLKTVRPEHAKALDAAGRFIPYWYRDKTNLALIHLTPLINMETSFYYQGIKNRVLNRPETDGIDLPGGVSSFYQNPIARFTSESIVTEPYDYEGKLMVEQTYPILLNGRFVGIAGVDRALTELDQFLTGLKPFKTADLLLISRRGRIISATMNPQLKTKRIEDTPYSKIILPFYQSPAALPGQLVKDPVDQEPFFYHAVKIPTGDWTLVMRVSEQEIFAPVWRALRFVLAVAAAGLALTAVILVWMATAVSRRVAAAAQLVGQVAQGDLTAQVETTSNDETGVLLRALRTMVSNLNKLIGKVKSSSIQLVSTATQISAAAKSQEAMVSDFGSSTNEVAAAVSQISATSQALAKTVNEVAERVSHTAQLADAGRGSLAGMESTMHSLATATNSISSKLGAISEKAKTITTVVTTITKVADQTNLLSLNAAIEAEKAGEYGLGFSVVAREIRRLADQTAVATLDIDQMVKEMQSAVSAGVMEMDKFTDQVKRGVDATKTISEQLGLIIEEVKRLTPSFESVHHGMRSQSEGAAQISTAMTQLSEAVRTTASSIQEFNNATANLHEAVRSLREEIAQFKMG